jgi:hypothetical protein
MTASSPKSASQSPSDQPVIRRAIRYGIILTIAVIVVGGIVGYLAGGVLGLVSALIGAGITAVFMGVTAVSFLVAGRLGKLPEGIAIYYGIILGTFIIKFVIFLVLVIALRSAHWLNPTIFGLTTIVAVLGTLVVDMLALLRSRVTYVDVQLPGEKAGPAEKSSQDS